MNIVVSISYTRDLFMTRTGVNSGLEKHHFHQAEDPCSPDLRKGDQTFYFCMCIHKREVFFPVKVTFFSNSNTKCKTVVCL